LDLSEHAAPFEPSHDAFPVTEDEFDAILAVSSTGADVLGRSGHTQENVINRHGRGFSFEDSSGHNMEVLTRPYGT
jgi:hypothetical protein